MTAHRDPLRQLVRSQTHKDGPCYFLLCKQTIPQISGWTQRLLTFSPWSSRSAVWAGISWKVSAASQAALPLGVGWLLAARGWLGQHGDVAPCLSSPTRQARACLLPEAEDFQEQQGDLHKGRSAFQASVYVTFTNDPGPRQVPWGRLMQGEEELTPPFEEKSRT